MPNIIFFKTPKKFYKWLEKNHEKKQEQWIGFYKKSSGKPSITWSESVDAALCFGWIDGIRKSIDEISYKIRFTPRKANSNWSAININKVKELSKLGMMQPAGLKKFDKRDDKKSIIYSYENKPGKLDPAYEKKFKANKKAWKFFIDKAPWYRRTAFYWVMSAKKEETRLRRLGILIEDSKNEKLIAPLTRPGKSK